MNLSSENQNNNLIQDNNNNRTALHDAAASGDEKLVERLLQGGCDRYAKECKYGNTALHEAAWKGYSRCVKILCSLPKAKTNKLSDIIKETKLKLILHDAKRHDMANLHSALINTRNFGGFSALHLASQNGHNQSCREVLLAGGNPDVQNNYGDTPLHTACRYGHAGAIRILLSAKCDFDRVNLNGDTALHIAAAMGRRKLTRILLEVGCSQNIKNSQGEFARDIAIRKNLAEIVEILSAPVNVNRNIRERSSSSSRQNTKIPKEDKSKAKVTVENSPKYEVDPKHFSPYGCHYFPDPRNFPSPKLETLPKEPLLAGEQYYLDLAGNIRKGPIGIGNTCYCAPFFKHLENRMNQNRKSIKKYVSRAAEKIDMKVTELASKTDGQIGELTKSMIENQFKCENKRLHLEHWLKRGVLRSSGLHTSKSKKDEANTNTLSRCRSLEILDDNEPNYPPDIKTSTPQFSRSIDYLDETNDYRYSVQDESSQQLSHGGMIDKKIRSSKRSSTLSQASIRENYSVSDKDNDKEKNQSTQFERITLYDDRFNSSNDSPQYFEPKFDKSKVSERLEDLLSKTKKILELEKRMDNKYTLNLNQTTSTNLNDTYDIAQEMDKITRSLSKHKNSEEPQSRSNLTPLTPEILKDISSRKEHLLRRREDQTSKKSFSPYSDSRLDYNRNCSSRKSEAVQSDIASTRFGEEISESPYYHNSGKEHEPTVVNGFFSNTCFKDIPSSSNTTMQSASITSEGGNFDENDKLKALATNIQTIDIDSDNTDDECDITEITELNDLKSKIMKSTNWKSQVLQKSVHELFENREEFEMQYDQTKKYEIRNSEIKILKSADDDQEANGNRVQFLISKLQNDNLSERANFDTNESEEEEEQKSSNMKSLINKFEKTTDLQLPDIYSHTIGARSRNPIPTNLDESEIFSDDTIDYCDRQSYADMDQYDVLNSNVVSTNFDNESPRLTDDLYNIGASSLV